VQVAGNHLNQRFFAGVSTQCTLHNIKNYLRTEGARPVMAYSVPKNKIKTEDKRTAMTKPHLKRVSKAFVR